MYRHVCIAVCVCGIAILAGMASTPMPPEEPADALEGTLRVHPKFHYRYYIDGFGDGQECALFKADDRLKQIEPGTRLRVRGNLASQFFGDPTDEMAALAATWIIYMDVDEVEIIGAVDARRD